MVPPCYARGASAADQRALTTLRGLSRSEFLTRVTQLPPPHPAVLIPGPPTLRRTRTPRGDAPIEPTAVRSVGHGKVRSRPARSRGHFCLFAPTSRTRRNFYFFFFFNLMQFFFFPRPPAPCPKGSLLALPPPPSSSPSRPQSCLFMQTSPGAPAPSCISLSAWCAARSLSIIPDPRLLRSSGFRSPFFELSISAAFELKSSQSNFNSLKPERHRLPISAALPPRYS